MAQRASFRDHTLLAVEKRRSWRRNPRWGTDSLEESRSPESRTPAGIESQALFVSGGFTPMLAPGTRLGPYEILSPLGAGGMGEVYRAVDERLKREVAVKVLSRFGSHDPERLKRFEQEARAASALS